MAPQGIFSCLVNGSQYRGATSRRRQVAPDNALVRYRESRHPLHVQGRLQGHSPSGGYAGRAVDYCRHIPHVRSRQDAGPCHMAGQVGHRMHLGFPRDLEEDTAHSRSVRSCRRANHHTHLARAIAQS